MIGLLFLVSFYCRDQSLLIIINLKYFIILIYYHFWHTDRTINIMVRWVWSSLEMVLIDKNERHDLVQRYLKSLIHEHYPTLLHGHPIKQLTIL